MKPRPSRFEGRTPRGSKAVTPSPSPSAKLAREAMDWPRVSLEDMAEAVGVSRSAMAAYRAGERELPRGVALRLASWIRARAAKGERIAERLEAKGSITL